MKEVIFREMIRSMIKEMLVEKSKEISLNDVRKEAKKLGLKIKTSNVSWGYAATIFDTKSKLSTKGNVFSKSPEVSDFLKRIKKLKKIVGKKMVMFKNEKVSGLQEK